MTIHRCNGLYEPYIEHKTVDLVCPMPNAVIVLRHPHHPPQKAPFQRSLWGSYPRRTSVFAGNAGSDYAVTDAFGNRPDDPQSRPAPKFRANWVDDWTTCDPLGRTIARTVSLPPSIILRNLRIGTTPSGLVDDQSTSLSAADLEWSPNSQAYTTPLELHLMLEKMRRSLKASCGCTSC